MADNKLGAKLPPPVQRYIDMELAMHRSHKDTDTALFGTQVTKAWRIVKEILNGKERKKNEPSSPH